MNLSFGNIKNYLQFNKKPLDIKTSTRKGFTLVELVAVLAILGILIAIASPSLKYFSSESQETSLDTQTQAMYTVVVNNIIDATGSDVSIPLSNPDLFNLQNLSQEDVHFEYVTSVDTSADYINSLTTAHPDKYIIIVPVIDTVDYYPNITQDVVIVQPNSNVMFINGVKY